MSVNHFSSNLPEALWWSQHHHHHPPFPTMDSYTDHRLPPPTATFTFNNHPHPSDADREPMFEKPLTPSDVGKLNRLVIPKQHAEKYFPLHGGDAAAENQKGLLLGFEDDAGKQWRFRYSYWNSSQSYVLTKGWSRFVKEKRLDAGDVVLFERHRVDCDRMFIGWRRRSAAVPGQESVAAAAVAGGGGAQVNGWLYDAQFSYPTRQLPPTLPLPYQPNCLHAGENRNENNMENNQRANGNPRSVRLFGVNLECPDESEPSTPDGSSQGAQTPYQYYNNMNINFDQMRYHRG